ncbi:MAG: PAS domain-containing protein [Proteobacteria bacterium]|nr:PAS domain-containing protein [Pseudomonadota bacterium]
MNASDHNGTAFGAVDERGNVVVAKSADLQRLLGYWHAKRDGRAFPQRADLDPIDLRFMLERIALIEIHGDVDRRYKLRVVGSWWVQKYGFEPTGTWLENWPNPAQRKVTLDSYQALLAQRQPLLLIRNEIADDAVLNYEAMLLPFSEDGQQISMIVAAIGQR